MNDSEQKNKTERVVGDILSYIISNNLKLGDKLPSEDEMTQLFGVSRVSIREGLRGLRFLGLVESSTKRGTWIRPVDFRLLGRVLSFQIAASDVSRKQLLEARLAIELSVLDLLIGKITAEQLDELRALADCSCNGEDATELSLAWRHDREFHQKLLQFSGNVILIAFSELLGIFFQHHPSTSASAGNRMATAEHFGIIDALEQHNPELVRGLIRSHLMKYKALEK